MPGEHHPRFQPKLARAHLHSPEVALSGVAADDDPVDAWQLRQGLEQQIHSLPGIEVSRVADNGRRGDRTRLESAIGIHASAVGNDRECRARSEPLHQFIGEPTRDRRVPVGLAPHVRLPLPQASQFERRRRRRACQHRGSLPADRRREPVRLVDEARRVGSPRAQVQAGEAKVPRQHHLISAGSSSAGQRAEEKAHPPKRGRPGHADAFDRQPRVSLHAVVLERVSGGDGRVGPYDETHGVAASRQRGAGLDGLDAVGPLHREPDICDAEDPPAHRSPPSGAA